MESVFLQENCQILVHKQSLRLFIPVLHPFFQSKKGFASDITSTEAISNGIVLFGCVTSVTYYIALFRLITTLRNSICKCCSRSA